MFLLMLIINFNIKFLKLSNWAAYGECFTYPSNSSVKGHISWGADGPMFYSIESVSATFFILFSKRVFY